LFSSQVLDFYGRGFKLLKQSPSSFSSSVPYDLRIPVLNCMASTVVYLVTLIFFEGIHLEEQFIMKIDSIVITLLLKDLVLMNSLRCNGFYYIIRVLLIAGQTLSLA